MRQSPHKHIGQLLLSKGAISEDQLHIALQEQSKSRLPLGQLLVRLGFISETTIRDTLSEDSGHKSIDLTNTVISAAALALIPKDFAHRHRLIPLNLNLENNSLDIALADPDNIITLDQLHALLHGTYQLTSYIASESDILQAIDQHYGYELSIDGILHEIEPGETEQLPSLSDTHEFSQPIVRLIDAILAEAVQQGASDIHLEPETSFLRIRYRIDGVLHQVRSLHKSYWPAMVVRLKVMSNMNIAESHAPQDGHIALHLAGHMVDFRVATHPTTHGENIVLRILDRQKGIVPIDKLGLDNASLDLLKEMIARPEGIILVTGPTGSGKTTTLYSILSHLNTEAINIMTLEDPVEYPIPLIRQNSINDSIRLDFASGLRSLMRQDPDVILVGEIRDRETAEMAFRAAMTGHQVFSTLHSNSAMSAIPRLQDMGIRPGIMAGNIIGIIAQRLIRSLCPHCKVAYLPNAEECMILGIPAGQHTTIFRASGCAACRFRGYSGRIAIMETLHIDRDLDALIARQANQIEIEQLARTKGFRPLAQDGIQRILSGQSSIAEVSRVAYLHDRI